MFIVFLQIVFWGSLFCIAHSYAFYPIILQWLSRNRHQNEDIYSPDDSELPEIDILLAAYNEEVVIEEKIRSTFDTTYPVEKIRFFIGSDCSTDRTNELVEKAAKQYPTLQFRVFSSRTGKPEIINRLKIEGKAPLIVMTDANVFFSPETLYELVKHYHNSSIGVVGGNILNLEVNKAGISGQEKAYLQREAVIKYREGILWGAMIGAFGGCFSIRREAYHAPPSHLVCDDFWISMSVFRKQLKAIYEPKAICYEDVSDLTSEEFRRKTRISTGNFENLYFFRDLLATPWRGMSFAFWSHRVFRWLGPHFMVLMLISNLLLVGKGFGGIYEVTLAGQLLVPALMGVDWVLRRQGIHSSLLRFVTHFYTMNAALLLGFWRHIRGVKVVGWKPTQRFQRSQ